MIRIPEANTVFAYETAAAAEVSVVIPLYNYEAYVEETLNSVARQSLQAVELVIVDDKSTDRSLAVVTAWCGQWAERFTGCRVLTMLRNSGPGAARNLGFSLARTPFVFALDADNQLYRRCLARCAEVMSRSDAGVVYTQLERFGDEAGIGPNNVWNPQRFEENNYVDGMALIRKSAWQTAGGYSGPMMCEDYDLWCKFIEHGFYGIFIPEILCRYRVHGASRTATISDVEARKEMRLRHPWLSLL